MSTNKTPNYNLHAWEPDDDFLRSEMNENFAAIDAEASRVVCGVYYGDGTSAGQVIDLGFRPLAVLVFYQDGPMYSNSEGCGLAVGDNPSGRQSLVITDIGFRVKTDYVYLNVNQGRYHYVVFH